MKYYAQVHFLTGGWNHHWSYRNGSDTKEAAIADAEHLGKFYIFTRVIDEDDAVVWVSKGSV